MNIAGRDGKNIMPITLNQMIGEERGLWCYEEIIGLVSTAEQKPLKFIIKSMRKTLVESLFIGWFHCANNVTEINTNCNEIRLYEGVSYLFRRLRNTTTGWLDLPEL